MADVFRRQGDLVVQVYKEESGKVAGPGTLCIQSFWSLSFVKFE